MIQGLDLRSITECVFELQNVATARTLASGGAFVLRLGEPYWTAEIRIEAPTRQAFAVWDAFFASRKGPATPFLLGRKFFSNPRGGAVSDSGLTIEAIDQDASTIDLSGAGTYTAKIGDMFSYKTASGGYWIGQVVAEAVAVSGDVTLSVVPTPAEPHASAPAPRRYFPFGEFYLDGPVNKEEGGDPRYLELSARQLIRVSGDPASPLTAPAQGANLSESEAFIL